MWGTRVASAWLAGQYANKGIENSPQIIIIGSFKLRKGKLIRDPPEQFHLIAVAVDRSAFDADNYARIDLDHQTINNYVPHIGAAGNLSVRHVGLRRTAKCRIYRECIRQ